MRKLFWTYIALLTLVSCSGGGGSDEPDVPIISKDYINVTPNLQLLGDGQETELKITATCAWTISNSASWLAVTPSSGKNNENVKVSAGKNSTGAERVATLTITGGNAPTKTVVVTQPKGSEPPALTVDQNLLNFDWGGETKALNITSNVSWTISKPEWCTINKLSGRGNDEITVTVSENTSKEERSGQIVVNGEGVDPITIEITQQGKDVTNTEEPGADDNTPPK